MGHEDRKQGHITKERSTALIHTVDTLVLLVKYLLQHHKLQCILLGKFQTDTLKLDLANIVVSLPSHCMSQDAGHFENTLPGYVNIEGIVYIYSFNFRLICIFAIIILHHKKEQYKKVKPQYCKKQIMFYQQNNCYISEYEIQLFFINYNNLFMYIIHIAIYGIHVTKQVTLKIQLEY